MRMSWTVIICFILAVSVNWHIYRHMYNWAAFGTLVMLIILADEIARKIK